MAGREVLIVRTGTANLASVAAALNRVGAPSRVTRDSSEVRAADHVVLPGVGAFGSALARLRETSLLDALLERLEVGRPTLAICLGLQILCAASAETPGVPGLGVIPDRVGRFEHAPRVPQLGWNAVQPAPDCQLLTSGYAYFANSYRLRHAPSGWASAHCEYGERFVAALERGAILGCQFHPELSGAWGLDLIRRWWTQTSGNGGSAC